MAQNYEELRDLLTAMTGPNYTIEDGDRFQFDMSNDNVQGAQNRMFLGANEAERGLSLSDTPPTETPSGSYFWANNPEKVRTAAGTAICWKRTVSAVTTGGRYRFGMNLLDYRDGGNQRSVFLWFQPDPNTPRGNMSVALNNQDGNNTGTLGIFRGIANSAITNGKDALRNFYLRRGTTNMTALNPRADGWFVHEVGAFDNTPSEGGNSSLITGLMQVAVSIPGTLYLTIQETANPQPPNTAAMPIDTDNPERRARGTINNHAAEMFVVDPDITYEWFVIPAHATDPDDFSFVQWWPNHEQADTVRQDIDFVRPVHRNPDDVDWNNESGTVAKTHVRQTVPYLQSNYQVEVRIVGTFFNESSDPVKVVLLAIPKGDTGINDSDIFGPATANSFPNSVALYDLDAANNGRAVPKNEVAARWFVDLNDPGIVTRQMIRINTYTVPPCEVSNFSRRFSVANGGSGRFYFALVPLLDIAGGLTPAATPCESTTDSTTSNTYVSTSLTTYTETETATETNTSTLTSTGTESGTSTTVSGSLTGSLTSSGTGTATATVTATATEVTATATLITATATVAPPPDES